MPDQVLINGCNVSKNFQLWEYACPCCQLVKLKTRLVLSVQELRDYLGIPMRFNSAFRCNKHNKEVGGSPTSEHKEGGAIDISDLILPIVTHPDILRKMGFTTVLYYPGKHFWHLDVRERDFVVNLNYHPTTKAQGV